MRSIKGNVEYHSDEYDLDGYHSVGHGSVEHDSAEYGLEEYESEEFHANGHHEMVKIRAKRFISLEEIKSCTNGRVSLLLDMLADGYAALHKQSARSRIYALAGMALAMLGEARAGNEVLFEQFDASVHLLHRGGAYFMPPNPPLLVTLGGEPFWLCDDAESMWMENALWDSFLIMADNLGDGMQPVSQFFYDFADRRQCLAYRTQQLYRKEELHRKEEQRWKEELHRKEELYRKEQQQRGDEQQRGKNQEWTARLNPQVSEIKPDSWMSDSAMQDSWMSDSAMPNLKDFITKLISSNRLEIMVQVTNNFYGAVTVNGTMSGDVHNPVFYGSVQNTANAADAAVSCPVESSSVSSISESASSTATTTTPSSSHSVDVFTSEAARRVMGQLVEIGVLDEDLQPLHLSWSERGVLAQQVSLKLGIENQWVTFGELWNMKASALRSAFNTGMNQVKIGKFLDRILPAIG